MRRPRFVDLSRFTLKYIFNWRFWIAEITKKSKAYASVVDKFLFEDDEIIVVPNTINVNKKIESEGSEFLPTEVIKEVIKRNKDIVIMNSCLCRTSNKCQDYPKDIGCIFLGPTSQKIPVIIYTHIIDILLKNAFLSNNSISFADFKASIYFCLLIDFCK